MRFGIALANQFPAESSLRDEISKLSSQVQAARDLGFDALLAGEHRLSDPYSYCAAFPLLARLAADAEGMDLVAVSVLPLHHPVDVAEDGATLDAICGGRFVLAAALGYRDIEYEAFGIDRSTRVERLEESLDVLDLLWTSDRAEYDGQHFRIPPTPVRTRPTRPGGPPVWLAGNGDRAVDRAAARGLPWLVAPAVDFPTISRQLARYREAAARPPEEVPVVREVLLATTRDRALEMAQGPLAQKYDVYARAGHDKTISASESFAQPFEELARDRFIVGTPDDCLGALQALADEGVTLVFVHSHWSGLPDDAQRTSMELFGREVIPAWSAS